MELGKQIRELRNKHHMNQDELAEKLFVTRQTVSNWENDKSYPDIQSLLLLSNLFEVSLDQLVKGDVEMMKKKINEVDMAEFYQSGKVLTILMFVCILSGVPLIYFLGVWGFIPFVLLWMITIAQCIKAEKLKKKHNVQTYKEIVSFMNGESLDEITKQREVGKRPYQKTAVVILFSLGSALIAVLMLAVLIWLF